MMKLELEVVLRSPRRHSFRPPPGLLLVSTVNPYRSCCHRATEPNCTMANKDGERSASSATRFTATTPHASSKVGSSRFPPPPGAGGPSKPAAPIGGSAAHSEPPEQRVARLRAAHERAKSAKVSRFDQVIAKSRPFFDSAHRITVLSLVGLTGMLAITRCYAASHLA